MVKITNTAEGPRGVLLTDGTTHYVEPGQTVDLDVAKGHTLYDGLTSGKAVADPEAPKALSAMNKAELLEAAAADGVATFDKDGAATPIADGTNKEIVAAIEAKRAAA